MAASDPLADVSRETIERLRVYQAEVERWNPVINLVGPKTLPNFWERHIIDSAQVYFLQPNSEKWADFGSGGGLPGLVVAILAQETNPGMDVTLVESDKRKAAFLQSTAAKLDLPTVVQTERAENLGPMGADVVSARALMPLSGLLSLAHRHLAPTGTAVFPKGKNHERELSESLESWVFQVQKHQSITDPSAVIFEIRDIARANR